MTLLDWLKSGPFTLALSSGFFGFFAHAGFRLALEDAGIEPAAFSGSSAGALVAGAWAAGVGAASLRDQLLALRRDDFWDPAPGAGLLRGRLFQEKLDSLVPVPKIEDLERPLTVSTFDVWSRTTHVQSSGSLTTAVRASCAVPGLFQPVDIQGRPQLDGGILDRPGIAGVQGAPRILYHHLASKSPWRLAVPRPPPGGIVTVSIRDLPRSGPFRLHAGRRALDSARLATMHALRQTITRNTFGDEVIV